MLSAPRTPATTACAAPRRLTSWPCCRAAAAIGAALMGTAHPRNTGGHLGHYYRCCVSESSELLSQQLLHYCYYSCQVVAAAHSSVSYPDSESLKAARSSRASGGPARHLSLAFDSSYSSLELLQTSGWAVSGESKTPENRFIYSLHNLPMADAISSSAAKSTTVTVGFALSSYFVGLALLLLLTAEK